MAHQTFFYWLNNSIPSSIRIVTLADMGCLICLLNIGTLKMVLRLLPDGEISLLNNLLPAKAPRNILNLVLLLLEVVLGPLPPLVVCLPIDWRTRENPISSWP